MLSDPPGHHRLDRNDDEIVARLVALTSIVNRQATLLTYDVGMFFRARTALAGMALDVAEVWVLSVSYADASMTNPSPPARAAA